MCRKTKLYVVPSSTFCASVLLVITSTFESNLAGCIFSMSLSETVVVTDHVNLCHLVDSFGKQKDIKEV